MNPCVVRTEGLIPVRGSGICKGPEAEEALRDFRKSGESGIIGMVVIKLNK